VVEDVLDERKTQILRAIIADYVTSAEPVGSRRVVEVAHLDVSPATVRNEMAALEELGFISQPHTSAGRVPTSKGYRYLVDHLRPEDDPQPLDGERRELISEAISQARDVDELLTKATSALAQLTHLVALVVAPALEAATCKVVEVVSLGPRSVLVLLIADTGSVHKRIVELDIAISEADVDRVRVVLNEQVRGRRMGHVRDLIGGLAGGAPTELRPVLGAITAAIGSELGREAARQVFIGGSSSLATERSLDRGQLERVLELLEERETLVRAIDRGTAPVVGDESFVTIGEEHELADLHGTSLVGQRYDVLSAGSLGILGPIRMDYAAVLSAVRAVADELERGLSSMGEGR